MDEHLTPVGVIGPSGLTGVATRHLKRKPKRQEMFSPAIVSTFHYLIQTKGMFYANSKKGEGRFSRSFV